jgi:hypothetical protein
MPRGWGLERPGRSGEGSMGVHFWEGVCVFALYIDTDTDTDADVDADADTDTDTDTYTGIHK